jgi:hypothetical protein
MFLCCVHVRLQIVSNVQMHVRNTCLPAQTAGNYIPVLHVTLHVILHASDVQNRRADDGGRLHV